MTYTRSFTKGLFGFSLILAVCFTISGCMGMGSKKSSPGQDQAQVYESQQQKNRERDAWALKKHEPNHLALARDLVRDGHYDVALVQLDKAIELGQGASVSEIYTLKGICARETGDMDHAGQWLAKALELDPENADAWNHQGIVLTMDKLYDMAKTCFDKAIALDPGNPDYFNNKGILYTHAGDTDGAVSCFRKALTLDPENQRALNNLALSLGHKKEYKQAFSLLTRHYPYWTACHNMGVVYARAGEVQKSRNMFMLADKSIHAMDAQILNPMAPVDPTPPAGIPGETGNALYRRSQDQISNGGE